MTHADSATVAPVPHAPLVPWPLLVLRAAAGGVLMGLANLVPGISGGTMLLATGVYPHFIAAIAELTMLRFRARSLAVLGIVVFTAVLAIAALAGLVGQLVVDHRWVMYSLFIGLTLGGVPIVWRMLRPATGGAWLAASLGFVGMALLALVQAGDPGAAASQESQWVLLLLAGLAGASAMILPGLSGGYLLLVLGQYVPILRGIDQFKDAVQAGDLAGAWEPAVQVVLPVGIGVVVGVVAVSNLLKWLLARFEKPTLGVLLGLLVGAVVGIWPFQQSVTPPVGTIFKGLPVTAERLPTLDPADFPTALFTPTPGQVAASILLIIAGFAITHAIGRMGGEKEKKK